MSMGELVNQLCNEIGAEKRRSSPYHPEGDGQAERSIQTIKTMVRCMVAEKTAEKHNWPSILQEVVFAHNVSPNSSTSISPYEW